MRQQLIGPACDGELGMSPLERYPTGVLYPVEPGASGIDPASADHVEASDPALLEDQEEETLAGAEPEDKPLAQSVRRRRYVPPSSIGFSCFVRGEARLSITVSAAIYQGTEERGAEGRFQSQCYERTKLDERNVKWLMSEAGDNPMLIWEGRAGIHVQPRSFRNGVILTVALFNRQKVDESASPRHRFQSRAECSLFEVKIECVVEGGELLEYPRVDPSLLTEEEQELELQYKKHRIYAVGHGTAVDWKVKPGTCARLWSEFMPEVEVPLVTVDVGGTDKRDERVRSLAHLAGSGDRVFDDLEYFTKRYAGWIEEQQEAAFKLQDPNERAAAKRICTRMAVALDRMRGGLALLRSEPLAAESFQLANRAMLDQMHQSDRVRGKETNVEDCRWRPFQLAFLLTVMKSTIREDDDHRNVLDLIWFPTGGGKTEAYLGLIAFLIVWRRLKYGDKGGGTAAFMRYTLRLLTQQQFKRAARMICALELIRRENPDRLGEKPVSIGIWVGSNSSPNLFVDAMNQVEDIQAAKNNSTAQHTLILEACPWCGVSFDATRSYCATENDFHFHCANRECDFGTDSRPLPCNVVDEALYVNPPSLLIATIDKFARLAWKGESSAFFGIQTETTRDSCRPPELVIQDELHLITGPLGSVAGLYEAGVDTLLSLLADHATQPKYIASTATIRMARQQVQRLYARDLSVFPPPGLSCDNSYFACTDDNRPGRLYVGYLAPMLDQQHCLSPLAAALLTGPLAVFNGDQERDALLEAWWTQVIYHGSLKGVSNTHNAYDTDVRDFAQRLLSEFQQKHRSDAFDENNGNALESPETNDDLGRTKRPRIAQLTSMRTAEENAATFGRLTRAYLEEGCLDAVLATNMISVGLDVARLALMVVNGQPLTTAEYIQASSRVGRAEVPGLVFVNYYRNQARSLSHYENFRPYHESFYRFVEPSSVTPYTYQVRSRALHAALVIALRHVCNRLRSNTAAGEFDPESREIVTVIEALKRRCCQAAEPGQATAMETHINRLVEEWHDEVLRCKHYKRKLNYQERNKNSDRLLYGHGESRPGLWRTLHAMRNVENTGRLKRRD